MAKASKAKKPLTKKAVVKIARAKKVVAKKIAPKKPVTKKSVTKKSVAKQPAPQKSAAKKSTAPILASKKTVPVAKKSATKIQSNIIKLSTSAKKPMTTSSSKKAANKTAITASVPSPKPIKRTFDYKPAKLPQGYKPTEKEDYMNPFQQEYFRQKLLAWRDELLSGSRETLEHLHEEDWHQADIADRASLETEAGVELRTRNRYLKLIAKIDSAIARIETGEYGYCEETGEEIGLKRLEARPVATMTIDAQERHEKIEKQYTDED